MKAVFALLAAVAAMTFLVAPAAADWNDGDPYKMHFPQLPDPNGLDVEIWNAPVGDDWTCSATGPVSDIHFWYSWFQDYEIPIESVTVRIYDNVPAVGGPDPIPSQPGERLWGPRTFGPNEFVTRWAGSGDQGWFSPTSFADPILHDHQEFYQMNITQIRDPFIQKEGEIYWLVLEAEIEAGHEFVDLGWKTSLDRHEDAAVFLRDPANPVWSVVAPEGVGPVNMAFVITPEPSTCVLLSMGGLAFCGYFWRKRRRR